LLRSDEPEAEESEPYVRVPTLIFVWLSANRYSVFHFTGAFQIMAERLP